MYSSLGGVLPDFLTTEHVFESNKHFKLGKDELNAVLLSLQNIVADAELVRESIKWKEKTFAPRDMFEEFDTKGFVVPEKAPLMPIIVLIAGIGQMRSFYQKHCISDKIFGDTIEDIARNIRVAKRRNGRYAIESYIFDWLARHMTCRVFHLGRLQFEAIRISEDSQHVKAGEYVLNTHIPSGSKLDYGDVQLSYRQAASFFERLTPHVEYRGIVCDSWMLSPALKEVLHPDSNLVKFLSDYEIFRTYDDESFYNYVFIKKPNNLSDLQEDTLLQRRLKQYLLSGMKIMSAGGFIPMHKIV